MIDYKLNGAQSLSVHRLTALFLSLTLFHARSRKSLFFVSSKPGRLNTQRPKKENNAIRWVLMKIEEPIGRERKSAGNMCVCGGRKCLMMVISVTVR